MTDQLTDANRDLQRFFGVSDEEMAEYLEWKSKLTPDESEAILKRQGVLNIAQRMQQPLSD